MEYRKFTDADKDLGRYATYTIEETGNSVSVYVDEAEFWGVGSGADTLVLAWNSELTEEDMGIFRNRLESEIWKYLRPIRHPSDLEDVLSYPDGDPRAQ